jgi:hypothetical protein
MNQSNKSKILKTVLLKNTFENWQKMAKTLSKKWKKSILIIFVF